MSEHKVLVEWSGDREDFSYQTYTRNHCWSFEGGSRVEASAAPGFLGDESRVDPEEALVASLSSCHMLTFWQWRRRNVMWLIPIRMTRWGLCKKIRKENWR